MRTMQAQPNGALAPKSVPMGYGPFSVDLLIPKRTKTETHVVSVTLAISAV